MSDFELGLSWSETNSVAHVCDQMKDSIAIEIAYIFAENKWKEVFDLLPTWENPGGAIGEEYVNSETCHYCGKKFPDVGTMKLTLNQLKEAEMQEIVGHEE